MHLSDSHIQKLREYSRDEVAFQHLLVLMEELFENRRIDTYRSVAKDFPHGSIIIVDSDLRHLVADGQALTRQGFTQNMIEGKTLDQLPLSDAVDEYEAMLRAALTGERIVTEITFGGRINQFRTIPLATFSGTKPLGMVIGVDVTELRQSALLQRTAQHFLAQILAVVPDALYVHDITESRNVYANHEIGRWLGYTPEELQAMGSNLWTTILHPDDVSRVVENNRRFDMLAPGEFIEIEYRMRRKDGEWRWFYSREGVFKLDEFGKPLQTVGIAQDITERKLSQQRLLELEVERERVQLLRDFIADGSHELRAPLSLISTGVYLMTRLTDAEARSDKATQVEHSVEHLDRIFEYFYEVDRARTPNDTGTGMGLTFVKRIMKLHAGSVSVRSEVGSGTTVRLHFPMMKQ